MMNEFVIVRKVRTSQKVGCRQCGRSVTKPDYQIEQADGTIIYTCGRHVGLYLEEIL